MYITTAVDMANGASPVWPTRALIGPNSRHLPVWREITVVTATIVLYIEIQPLNLSVAKRLEVTPAQFSARHTYYGNGQISLTETLEKHT